MKEEILSIASDLREGSMTTNEARNQLLRLFGVMQAEGSDVSEWATVASEGREKHVRGGCIDRTRKKDGPCCYPVGTCYDCQVP